MRFVPSARWARVLALAVSVSVLLLVVEIAASGRTRRPLGPRASAIVAYESASRSGGSAWAPQELGVAREALWAALLDFSRQQARPFPLRDFRGVAVAFERARALAARAEQQGNERRDAARAEAAAAVRDAQQLEQHALELVAVTILPRAQRARLLGARLLAREAEALLLAGDVRAAGERAQRSEAELREALGPALAAAERYRSQEQVATWRRWIAETQGASRKSGEPAILVFKEKNLLVLIVRGEPMRRFDAEVGANALEVKQSQGDRATPEGRYRIVTKNERDTVYHRALLLDYPNSEDRARFAAARRRGEIPSSSRIGGQIEIHGGGGRGQNWTDGCIALRNPDIDELFARVKLGTPVTIVGGDGSDGAFSSLLAKVHQPAVGP